MVGFKRQRQRLIDSGDLFEDEEFPAAETSIFYKRFKGDGWDNIEWKRPKDICEEPQFYTDGASRFDLDQGALGNCWFLSAAATLASKQKLFKKVVPRDQQSFQEDYAGIFRFNFWQYGHWEEIIVDDRLPTRNNKLVFCHNRESPNEFWSALMEKAYAKMYGCYQSLETGYSHDALVDFTGGIGEFIDLKKVENKDKLFRTLRNTQKMNSLMATCIEVKEGGTYEQKMDNGLVVGHAYSITKVAQFKLGEEKVRLFRLQNPWGYKEWNGAWSDSDEKWSEVPEDVKERLQFKAENEGEFWIAYEDFLQHFDSVQLCHLTPDSVQGGQSPEKQWKVESFHGSWIKGVTAGGCGAPPNQGNYWMNPQYYVRVSDPDETDDDDTAVLVVSLMQKYRRHAKIALQSTTDIENPIGFDLMRYNGDAPEELNGWNADDRALRIERKMTQYEFLRERSGRFVLTPGVYCIIPATYETDTEGEFLLRLATMKPVESGEVGTTQQATQQVERPPKRPNRFDKMFDKFSGDDEVVDAAELRKILNKGLKLGEDENLSKETCRALIASVVTPQGSAGTATKNETRKAWREARRLKGIFEDYDVDDSLTLNKRELKEAFKAIGYDMRKSTLGKIADQYCGKEEGLSLDDFIRLAVRTSNVHDRFQNQQTDMSFDDFLEAALLT